MTARAPAAQVKIQRAPEPARANDARRVQLSLQVSHPNDSAEREAESTARKVVAMPDPVVAPRERVSILAARAPAPRPPAPAPAALKDNETSPELTVAITSELGGGSPLPADTRSFMEPRFKADFSRVRVHTDARAANLTTRLGARAFAYGRDIFFNAGQFQPDTPDGMELIAHELTHTIQQREVVQREVAVTQKSAPRVQRGIISRALDWIADKANYIPGFRLFTIIIGLNPINMSAVDRSGANILRALVEFLPGGGLIVDALDNYGIFEKGGKFIEDQFRTLGMVGSMFRDALMKFIDSLGWSDVFHLGDVWDRAKRIFTEPIDRLIDFGKSLVNGVITIIKDAILKPLAALVSKTPAWDLLCAVMGKNPITGEVVERSADNLIGGFMKLIGQEEIWANIKRANAIPRAWTWFKNALNGLMSLVLSIPTRFITVLKSLVIMDIVVITRVVTKVGGVFVGFFKDFFSWAGGTVLGLLEIILEVVAPAAVPYLKKAGAAFRTIIKNPIAFVRTLVRAAVQGFKQFASNFLAHLKASLIAWLTGSLGGTGVYIPQGFTLLEILKFVLSVMGLTWTNIRAKLVKATSETVVKVLETTFDIVKTLVTEGPAAAWQKIVETLTNLKDLAIDAVMDFVKSKVVEAAVTKLLSMLSPAGAFIQAIIAIYNTIMFFVERIRQIAQVAASFIDGIAAIAAGNIAPAADRVEATMAGLLTLVISFLARIAGLGKVSDAIKGLIEKIRAPIDKALDKVVEWIVATAKKLGKMAKEGVAALFEWWKEKLGFTNDGGESHTLQFIGSGPSAAFGIATSLQTIQSYLDTHPDKTSTDSKKKSNWATASSVFDAESKVVFGFAKKTADEAEIRAGIAKSMAKISAAFVKLSGAAPVDVDYPENKIPNYGESTVNIHTTPLAGSDARPWPAKGVWKEIQDEGLTTITDRWVQMHVISDKLGGRGTTDDNLIPAPNSVNRGPFYAWEQKTVALAKEKSGGVKNYIWVAVKVAGTKEKPSAISGESGLYLWKGKSKSKPWMKAPSATLSVSVGVPKPHKKDKRKFSLNFTSPKVMIEEFGISAATAAMIYRGRPYTTLKAFEKSMLDRAATAGQLAAVNGRSPVLHD